VGSENGASIASQLAMDVTPLPFPWERVQDGDVTYYYNSQTQASQWEPPLSEDSGLGTEVVSRDATNHIKTTRVATIGGDNDRGSPPTPSLDDTLFHAVSSQYTGPLLVQQLLKHKANPAARRADGNLPVHVACAAGYVDCLEILIQHGGNWLACALGANGNTPAHCACQAGEWAVETVESLFRTAGERCFAARNTDNQTPLHAAVLNGNVVVLEWLLRFVLRTLCF